MAADETPRGSLQISTFRAPGVGWQLPPSDEPWDPIRPKGGGLMGGRRGGSRRLGREEVKEEEAFRTGMSFESIMLEYVKE